MIEEFECVECGGVFDEEELVDGEICADCWAALLDAEEEEE